MRKVLLLLFCSIMVWGFLNSELYAQEAEEKEEVYGITFGSLGTFAELHGFANIRYKDFQNQVSAFESHQFYVSAIAKVHPRITVFGEIEYEYPGKDVDPYITGGTLKLPKQKIMGDRVFIDWKLTESDLVTMRFGTFNPPIGWELAEYYAPARKFESRPQFVDEVILHEWVDTGLEFFGKYPAGPVRIGYDIAAVNGPRGLDYKAVPGAMQNTDNNSNRTITGRLSFSPAAYVDGILEVGLSTARGRYNAVRSGATGPVPATQRLDIIDYDFRWITNKVDVRGEYAKSDSDEAGDFKGDSAGYYLQGAYKFITGRPSIKYLEGLLRYDTSDISLRTANYDEQTRWTAGLNYAPYGSMEWRAEYQLVDRSMKTGK